MRARPSLVRSLALLAAVTLAILWAVVPIAWGVVTSLKPALQILTNPPSWIPSPATLDHYREVLGQSLFPVYFRNSVVVTVVSVALSLALSVHAAYALARTEFRLKGALLVAILATGMIPGIAILVPLYNLSVHTGLYNSFAGMVVVYTAWSIPQLVWLLKGFFERVPVELEEAALVDGCSRPRAFYLIALPMARPGLLAGVILAMMFVWNDFLIGFALAISEDRRILPVGLYTFISNIGIDWGPLMAATVVALLPVMAAFFLMQRWLVQGLMAGAVKG
jgi:ABC-type glycerol-3-phosphate transport system permease component